MKHYASNWTPSASDIVDGSLRRLIDICNANQCHLKFRRLDTPVGDFHILEFVARVPPAVDFREIVAAVSGQMRLTEWVEVPEKRYTDLPGLSFQDTHPLGFSIDSGKVFEGLYQFGAENDRGRKKSGEQK